MTSKKQQEKIDYVMGEFKRGELKSSSGQKVTSRDQAMAIALSEAGVERKARGGRVMKGMKGKKKMMGGGKTKKYASGGKVDGAAKKGKTKGRMC